MMKTRFDETQTWTVASGDTLLLEDMSTAHLMNVLGMFHSHPNRTMAMLISDLENGEYDDHVWLPHKQEECVAKSIGNVTSMDEDELIEYADNSPLGKAIRHELETRGVNVENALEVMACNACCRR